MDKKQLELAFKEFCDLEEALQNIAKKGKNLCLFTEGLQENEADIYNTTTQTEIFPSTHVHDIRSLFEADCVEISFTIQHTNY